LKQSAGIVEAKQEADSKINLNERKNMFLTKYQRPELAGNGFNRLLNLQDEFDRLFDSPWNDFARTWVPPLDVREDKNCFTVRAELPGMNREDIDVSLHDGALVITGERKGELKEEGVEIHRQERYYGRFQRAITLAAPVAADKVKANYKDGVLTITLPKTEEAKPKQIDVNVN
jgi:HSP20 family protein